MTVNKPYYRTARMFADGRYRTHGGAGYIEDQRYSKNPSAYVRAYNLILRDLRELFEYIEPADQNMKTFSYRIHELIVRSCIEIEANFKAVLLENKYSKCSNDFSMNDYARIEKSHFLSQYSVLVPYWRGDHEVRAPFENWRSNEVLPWHISYNASKHNRQEGFAEATFEHLLDAVGGLLVVLTAQFLDEDFELRPDTIITEGTPREGFEYGTGNFFAVKYPTEIPAEDRYEFNWRDLAMQEEPFTKFDYDALK